MDPKAPFADCNRCPLRDEHFVRGYGPQQADRVIVGEAPGEEEVVQGRPFVGSAGKLLDKAFAAADVDRSALYITNTVLCRPPSNADPLPAAIAACSGRLTHEIQGKAPQKVLGLGAFASEALTGLSRPIKEMRLLTRAPSPYLKGCEVRVTYHPAALRYMKVEDRQHFRDDIGWLKNPYSPRATARRLAEQGYPRAEIGRLIGMNEARTRWLLEDEL